MNRLLVLPLAAAVLALAGCGDDLEPVATALPGAPATVRDRLPLPFCGQEDVMLGGEGIDQGARDCFADALESGLRAELISTRRTPEGDPITQVFRAVAGGRIQVFRDTTMDGYGGRRAWLVQVCREYDPALVSTSRCSSPTPL